MSVYVKIKIDEDKILRDRGLADGSAQRALVHEVRRQMDPYVPLKSGVLKNSAQESQDAVTYNTPYARRQYYENRGRGLRGNHWDRRMMADRRGAIINFVRAYLAGGVGSSSGGPSSGGGSGGGKKTWVKDHYRNGKLIKGHWRHYK